VAGHRRGAGPHGGTKPRRCDTRSERLGREVMEAPTAGRQLAAAFDYFRVSAKHDPRAAEVMNEMATHLFTVARRLDERGRRRLRQSGY
jgi:hypothetical protein